MIKSWKTFTTGLLMVIGGITGLIFASKNGGLSEGAIMAGATSIIGGIGLIFAKDANVTGGTKDNGMTPKE